MYAIRSYYGLRALRAETREGGERRAGRSRTREARLEQLRQRREMRRHLALLLPLDDGGHDEGRAGVLRRIRHRNNFV